MEYIHIKNIDDYNPGYKDRQHIWAKIYWKIFIDEHYQELCEIDRHRLIGLIVFETYTQKPVPITPTNLALMGWECKYRDKSLTLKMLHKFIDIRNENVTQNRIEKNRIDKIRVRNTTTFTPPTLEEVTKYCQERSNHINPNRFIDFYQARGWLIGKSKMKDWRAAIRTWEQMNAKTEDNPFQLKRPL